MRKLLAYKLEALKQEYTVKAVEDHTEEIEAKVTEYRQSLLDADAREREEKLHTLEIKMAVVEEMLAEAELAEAAEEPTAAQEDTADTATYGGGYVHSTASNEVNL